MWGQAEAKWDTRADTLINKELTQVHWQQMAAEDNQVPETTLALSTRFYKMKKREWSATQKWPNFKPKANEKFLYWTGFTGRWFPLIFALDRIRFWSLKTNCYYKINKMKEKYVLWTMKVIPAAFISATTARSPTVLVLNKCLFIELT